MGEYFLTPVRLLSYLGTYGIWVTKLITLNDYI